MLIIHECQCLINFHKLLQIIYSICKAFQSLMIKVYQNLSHQIQMYNRSIYQLNIFQLILSIPIFILNFYNNINQMGAAGVCCPEPVEPPTPELAKCKRYLQYLAAGLLPIVVLALIVGEAMEIFICLFLFLFLFMGWRVLNWCSVLFYFLYCLTQIVQQTILIAGFIQYDRFFGKKYILDSVYLLVSELYFIVGIFVSHYVYKRFKNHSSGGALLPNNPPPENGPGRAPRQVENRPAAVNNQNIQSFRSFQGQGVRIGD